MLNAKESIVAAGPSATTLESRAKGNPLAVAYPEDGAVLMVSPSGILKNAPAPNAAKLLVEFLLPRDGNDIMVKHYQDPVNKVVEPAGGGKGRTETKIIRPSYGEIEKGIPEVNGVFSDTFGI